MKITPEIKKAIQSAIDEKYDNYTQFAKAVGVAHTTVRNWLNKESVDIDGEVWYTRVLPLLLTWYKPTALEFKNLINFNITGDEIKKGDGEILVKLRDMAEEFARLRFGQTNTETNKNEFSNAQPITSTPPPIPIVATAQAIAFDKAFQRLDEFATEVANEYAPSRIDMKPGIVAFKAEGRSMEPYYPDGTVIYIDSHAKPRNGKRVIAKLRETQAVIFKIYYQEEGKTRLVSINKDGQDFEWSSPKDNPFEWIFPVKYSFRDEDAIDAELDNHNIPKDVKV